MPYPINRSPYFDDYRADKNFHRVLYRPGFAVQTRELTQQQTILQDQINRIGSHVFKAGSIVLGCSFDIEHNIDVVLVTLDSSISHNDILGREIISGEGLKAEVVHSSLEGNDVYLFVRYKNSANSKTVFGATDALDIEGYGSGLLTVDGTSVGSFFSISEGIIFYEGFFVNVPEQGVTLSYNEGRPSAKVYFYTDFYTVTANDDSTLLDNAQGTPNFSAPGADRLAAEVVIRTAPLSYSLNENEFLFAEFTDGDLSKTKERTQYGRIYDELAKRTHDESGNYIVRGFNVYTREHLDTGTNEGRFSVGDGGDSNLLSIGIEGGLGYVHGFEINKLKTNYVDVQKATDYELINNQQVFVRSGNYILVNEFTGSIDVNSGDLINFYNQSEERVTNFSDYNAAPTGNLIGHAVVKNVIAETPDSIRVYVMNVRMEDGYKTSDIRAVGASSFFGDVVLSQTDAAIQDTLSDSLLMGVGSTHVRQIRNENEQVRTNFTGSKTEPFTISSSGTFTISSGTNESFGYGTGLLQSLAKASIIVTIDGAIDVSQTGTVDISGTAVTGTGTSFTNTFTIGERILVGGTDVAIVTDITSDTSITIDRSLTATGASFDKRFLSGDRIDLNGYGSNGEMRTVNASTDNLNIDIKENLGVSVNAYAVYNIVLDNVREISKNLRPNRYVKIDMSTLTSDRIYLGFSDVYKIREIRIHTSEITSDTDGANVTSQFNLVNGQRDSIYDHAYIEPRISLTGTEHLLVKLDYFEPDFSTGFGYFSVDSYPIDDTTESDTTIFTHEIPTYRSRTTGEVFNLRDRLDFRLVKERTATDATTITDASINPLLTDNFLTGVDGLTTPYPGSSIIFDYSFYLPRKDIVILNSDGSFEVVQGKSRAHPRFPIGSSDAMTLAHFVIPPYPSISSTYAREINKTREAVKGTRVANKRYTMRDISVLESRINTLEYYNALSLIEKETADMRILDENGLDRFKNGFFTDGFMDHSLGDRSNDDYRIAVNREDQYIRPVFEMDSFKSEMSSVTNVVENGGLYTLPFTEVSLLEQPNATTFRNIEQSVFRFIGVLELNPEIDTWVDNTTVDQTIETGVDEDSFRGEVLETEWGSWETNVTGYNVYAREWGDRSGNPDPKYLEGSFNSYADALAASRRTTSAWSLGRNTNSRWWRSSTATDNRSVIETVENQERTGIKTKTTYDRDVEELGEFVTDVSIVPYIRPQKISLTARGLKANTRFFVFFDGEDMNDYVTHLNIDSQNNLIIGIEGEEVRSNEYGEVYAWLRLPESGKRFRIGEKEIMITDSPTNAEDPSSYARNTFVAHGLKTKSQNTILSTGVIKHEDTEISQKREVQSTRVTGPSCMAYSFYVDVPENEKGVFLTSVDVFIESLHPELGVWFEIREMNSAGGITRTQVPYSEVWMYRDDSRLKTSSDGSVPTNIDFKAPVFLYNDTQYAFVIHSEGLNPDTYFFVARLGEDDLATGRQYSERQLTGTTYTTNNNLNWDIVPDIDLKVKFNRASFDTAVDGEIVFKNNDYEFVKINPDELNNFFAGDDITGSEKITLTNITGTDTIAQGDTIVGVTSGASGKAVEISSNVYATNGFDFQENESITVTGKDTTASISNVVSGNAELRKVDRTHARLSMFNTNSEFFVNGVIKNQHGNTLTITEFDVIPYSHIRTDSASLDFDASNLTFEYRGIYDSTRAWGNYIILDTENTVELDELKALESASNQTNVGGSYQIRGTLSTDSDYISPVIDVNTLSSVIISNIVNDDVTNETNPSNGDLINKYISKTITLAEGQDAEDLALSLTAYRPPNTDVHVWVRILNFEDPRDMTEQSWIELETDNTRFSSKANDNDFIEMNFGFPDSYMVGPNDEVQYDYNGEVWPTYKRFQVKIGLLSSDSHVIPKVADLRTIALQL